MFAGHRTSNILSTVLYLCNRNCIFMMLFGFHFSQGEKSRKCLRLVGTVKLLFANEAYSMGVDVHNVRRIIFIGSPGTIESQYIYYL